MKLIRGKTDVDCYPLEEEVQQTFTESNLPTRPARAKRKLVSIDCGFFGSDLFALAVCVICSE